MVAEVGIVKAVRRLTCVAVAGCAAVFADVGLLDWAQPHGEVRVDAGFAGKPLLVGGVSFQHGLGVSAPSRLQFRLDGQCAQFRAQVGIDEKARQPGEAVAVVLVDGHVAFRSPLMRRGEAPRSISIDVREVHTLELMADDMGHPAGDHVDWCAACIATRDGEELRLCDIFSQQSARAPRGLSAIRPRRAVTGAVTDYGANGDDQADDSAAFQRALNECVTAGQGKLTIPPGHYFFRRRVGIDAVGVALTIQGAGRGVSCLHGLNAEGVIRLYDPWCRSQITVKDLSFLADRQEAGIALEVSSPPRGARNFRTLTVQQVDTRGGGLPSRNFFDRGLVALAQWRPLFFDAIVSGVADPSLKDDGDDSPRYRMQYGIQADWCYAPSFQHTYVWSAHTGYRVVAKDRPEGPEDAAFQRAFAVGCRVGIDISTPIPEPQLVIQACHINCRDVGIRLHNRKFFQLRDNLMYGIDSDPVRPYVDIELTGNCFAGVIAGNIFHSPARHNLQPEPPVDRTMIRIGEKCRDIVVNGNVFNAKGRAVEAPRGTRRLIIRDNDYANPHVTRSASQPERSGMK